MAENESGKPAEKGEENGCISAVYEPVGKETDKKCHTAHGIRMAFYWILKHIVKAAQGLFLQKVYRGLDSRGFQIRVIFRQVHNLPGPLIIAGAYQVSPFIIA